MALPSDKSTKNFIHYLKDYSDYKKRHNVALVGKSKTGKTVLGALIIRTLMDKKNQLGVVIDKGDAWLTFNELLINRLENPKKPQWPTPTPHVNLKPYHLNLIKEGDLFDEKTIDIRFNDIGGEFYNEILQNFRIAPPSYDEDDTLTKNLLWELLTKDSYGDKVGPYANIALARCLVFLFDFKDEEGWTPKQWMEYIGDYSFILSSVARRRWYFESKNDRNFDCKIAVVFTKSDQCKTEDKSLDAKRILEKYANDFRIPIEAIKPRGFHAFKIGIKTKPNDEAGKDVPKFIPDLDKNNHLQAEDPKEMESFLHWLLEEV